MATKKQHIIPQFYLRNFSCDNSQQQYIWVYDSEMGTCKKSNIKDTAHENYYFGARLNDGTYANELEDLIAKIEGKAAPLLCRFRRGEYIESQDKADLASFFALMVVRTKTFRRLYAEMRMINVQAQMYANAIHDEKFNDYISKYEETTQKKLTEAEKEDLRQFSLNPQDMEIIFPRDLTIEAIRFHDDLVPIFYNMNWSLLKINDKSSYFITSDNPVVKFTKSRTLCRGGFLDPNIEVMLPLSIHQCWFGHWNSAIPKVISSNSSFVKRINKQCAVNAERFIFCHKNDDGILSLAKKYNTAKPTIKAYGFGPENYLTVKIKRLSGKKK